jgi:2-polyprenyl-6-methoxyphenol hydroxylase-like FAD-dependent oxidoreductase
MRTGSSKILAVGAGIGGLALALALQKRAIGVEVWEKAPMLREIGAGLLLTSNAVWVLDRLGVLNETIRRGIAVHEWQILDRSARRLQTFQARVSGVGSISIARAAFQEVLLSAVSSEAVRLGHEVISIANDPTEGVDVQAANGHTKRANVVVGADGTRSIIRNLAFDPRPPRQMGYVGWRGMVDRVPDGWKGGRISESWGDGGRFGIAPVSDRRTYWYATENVPIGWTIPVEERKSHLLDRFGSWHTPISELIEATPDESILLNDIAEMDSLKTWQSGSIALLGDAAHLMTPNLGQGAAMALEDAWILAESFERFGVTPDALAHYEKCRQPRVRRIVRQSRQVGRLIQFGSPTLSAMRDLALRLLPDFVGTFALAPVFNFRVVSAG